MFNWIIELFTPTPSDWEVIEVLRGQWNIRTDFGKTEDYSVYEIQYSKSKNEYRMEISGYKPKQNSTYIEAVARLNELKNANN